MRPQLFLALTIALPFLHDPQTQDPGCGALLPRDGASPQGAPATLTQAGWISGTWIGTTANNVTVEERWTPPASGAMLENPAHDYPKLVRYSRLPDGSLQTTISAGGDVRVQSVVLRRQQ